MSDLVQKMMDKVDANCVVRSMRKDGCRLGLQGVPRHRIIVDFDKMKSLTKGDGNRADFLLVCGLAKQRSKHKQTSGSRELLVPIEVSSGGGKRASHVEQQLQAGVDWFTANFGLREQPRLVPVYCGKIDKHDRVDVKTSKFTVTLSGNKVPLRVIRCGERLTKVLDQ